MKGRSGRGWLLAAAALLTAALWPVRLLTLTGADGRPVFMAPVSVGEHFTVRFIHSVERRPVDEVFEAAADSLVLIETWFDMGGAGLPLDYMNPQLKFEFRNNLYHITGYDMRLPEVTYRINKVVADHTLLLRGREYKLKRWAPPGGPLTFRVEVLPAACLVWSRICQFVQR